MSYKIKQTSNRLRASRPYRAPPPPPRMIEGGFIVFVRVSSATKIISSKKVDFVRDICIGTHQNVVLRHNYLNPISTKLRSFDNNK